MSKNHQLATGVLVLALGVLSALQGILFVTARLQGAEWIYYYNGVPSTMRSTDLATLRTDHWVMDQRAQNYSVTNSNFYNNWTFGDTNYNTEFSLAAYHSRLGHYQSLGNAGASQIRLNGSGSLTITGWIGNHGTNNDSITYAMRHWGGAATLSFLNYDYTSSGTSLGYIDGAVIQITSGTYSITGATTSNVIRQSNSNFSDNATSPRWRVSNANTLSNTGTHYSYIYFDNNESRNGGAIIINGGTLNLDRNVFGTQRYEGVVGFNLAALHPILSMVPQATVDSYLAASPGSSLNHNYYALNERSLQALCDFVYSYSSGIVTITPAQVRAQLQAQGFFADGNKAAGYGNHATGNGGAIDVNPGATLSLTRSEFYLNTATRGGAVYNSTGGTVTSGGSNVFMDNESLERGGAVYNAGSMGLGGSTFAYNESPLGGAVFNDRTFSASGSFVSNTANGSVASHGGAVYNESGATATFSSTQFYGNEALHGFGGAIFNRGTVNLSNTDFAYYNGVAAPVLLATNGNKAIDGGAIYNDGEGSVINVTNNVTFDLNEATNRGGAIYNNLGTLNLNGATFQNNDAIDLGGAIYTYRGTVNLQSGNRLNWNSAEEGGAIYNDGATLRITGGLIDENFARTGDGGAIYNKGAISIAGQADFMKNKADLGRGGAIYNAPLATVDVNGSGNFSENTSLNGGGAIYNDLGGKLTIAGTSATSSVIFAQNAVLGVTSHGGAIYSSEKGIIELTDVIFRQNEATGDGGAIYNELDGTLTITRGGFTENKASSGNGGAIYTGLNGIVTVTGTEFSRNEAQQGGAVYNAENSTLTLTDFSFTGNFDTGNGGAIYNDGATAGAEINVNVITKSSFFGENVGDGKDGIYFTGNNNVFNVNVANKANYLDMRGNMTGDVGADVEIVKTGVGRWIHEGASTFNGTTSFAVDEGTLVLTLDSTLDLGGSSSLTLSSSVGNHVVPVVGPVVSPIAIAGTPSLILEPNTVITVNSLTTNEGSSIIAGYVNVGSSTFTINTGSPFTLGTGSIGATGGTVKTDVFNVEGATTIFASAFDFQASSELHFENMTQNASLHDGPFLTLSPTDPGVATTIQSDVYVNTPTGFTTGYVILGETTNNGTLGALSSMGGDFYLNNIYQSAIASQPAFARSATPKPLYTGLEVRDNTQLLFLVADPQAMSEDLHWTGVINSTWDAVTTIPPNLGVANWYGTTVDGISVDTFLNDDIVFFENTYGPGAGTAVLNKTVNVTDDFTVGAMTVGGTGYKFNLQPGTSITATGTIDFGAATIDVGTQNQNQMIVADKIVFAPVNGGSNGNLYFDVDTAGNGDKFLTLQQTNPLDAIEVSSNIDLSPGALSLALLPGEFIVLVEGINGTTLTQTGRLLVDGGAAPSFDRSPTPISTFLGLEVRDDNKIVLTGVADNLPSDDLRWTGTSLLAPFQWDSLTTAPPVTANWAGSVGGNFVDIFMDGDSVIFDDWYLDAAGVSKTTTNKIVQITVDAKVNSMTVPGTGYVFDLSRGGNIIAADAAIDFGTAALGNASRRTKAGTTITANETIAFAGNNSFFFDLDGVAVGGTVLTLDATNGVYGVIGDGIVNVSNLTAAFDFGDTITLIDALVTTPGVITDTGTLTVNGTAYNTFVRNYNAAGEFYMLEVDPTETQLLLTKVHTNDAATLYWKGDKNDVWDVRTTGAGLGAGTANWAGFVHDKYYVEHFMNYDTVIFADTYPDAADMPQPVLDPDSKTVTVAPGGVIVDSMDVTGSNYVFNLGNNSITAINDIVFSGSVDATVNMTSGPVTGGQLIADRVDFSGSQGAAVNLMGNWARVLAANDIDFSNSVDATITMNGGTVTATAGGIDFRNSNGATVNLSGGARVEAAGDIDFRGAGGAGVNWTTNGSLVSTAGDINFGSATVVLGDPTNLNPNVSRNRVRLVQADDIVLGTGSALVFDTRASVLTDDAFLTLDRNTPDLITVASDIYVSTPTTALGSDSIVLVEAINGSTLTQTGRLYVDGALEVFDRSATFTQNVLGLKLDNAGTQIILASVADNALSTNLQWAGTVTGGVWDARTTSAPGPHDGTANWAGAVGGHFVDVFLPGDTVSFGNTYIDAAGVTQTVLAANKDVDIQTPVRVGSMTVSGTDYAFNVGANITANDSIDFGTIVPVASAAFVDLGANITATNTIDFGNATLFVETANQGRTVTAGDIVWGTDSILAFNTVGAKHNDTFLTLNQTTPGIIGVDSDIYVFPGYTLATDEYIILVDAVGAGTTLALSGQLLVYDPVTGNFIAPVFERSPSGTGGLLGLDTITDPTQIRLKVMDTDTPSGALRWTGAVNGTWDDRSASTPGTKNWDGMAGGNAVNVFMNGDVVIFDSLATPGRRNVTIQPSGVTVADMTVTTGLDYVFNLTVGNTPAIEAAVNPLISGSTGSIDFGNAMLNITGYTPGPQDPYAVPYTGPNPAYSYTVVKTANGITGFDLANVTVAGIDDVDFLSAQASLANNDKDIVVETNLTWYSNNTGSLAHGDFTITGNNTFTLGVALEDNTNSSHRRTDWYGDTLTKKGTGTLILTADNAYTGGTTVEAGTLQLGDGGTSGWVEGDIVVGTTVVTNANVAFNRSDDVTFGENGETISGTGSLTQMGSGTLTLDSANTYTGVTNIEAGILRITNEGGVGDNTASGQIVNIGTGAAFDLAFGVNGNPCDPAAPFVVFNQQIRGDGDLFKSETGIVVMERANNAFTGDTYIEQGGIIIENRQALGTGTVHVGRDPITEVAATFTIGVGGTTTASQYGQSFSGDGAVYINPIRTGESTTILTGDSRGFVGDFIVCNDMTAELRNIYASGSNTEGSTTVRTDATLVFNLGPGVAEEYGRNISGDGTVVKNGNNTVILTGENENYTGDTTINAGILVADHVTNDVIDALGTGTVTINQNAILQIGNEDNLTGTLHNDLLVYGDGRIDINAGANGVVTIDAAANFFDDQGQETYTGKNISVYSGRFVFQNMDQTDGDWEIGYVGDTGTAEVELNGKIIDGVPCGNREAGDEQYYYNHQLAGSVTLDIRSTGISVIDRNNTGFTGDTNVLTGGLIIEHVRALGTGNVNLEAGTTFTIGVSGEYAQRIHGDGDVYINPGRTAPANPTAAQMTTTLTGSSTYTGDTILCSGTTVLQNINGTGANEADRNVYMRQGSVLEFGNLLGDVEYKKSIRFAPEDPVNGIPEGDGQVVINSGNEVILSGANTYKGDPDTGIGTVIKSGTLVAKNSSPDSDGKLHVDALGTGDVENRDTLVIERGTTRSGNVYFDNLVGGIGNLEVKAGSGTVALTRANTYTGDTTITSGTARLDHIDATGQNEASRLVTINAGAILNIAVDGEYNKTITGNGTLRNSSSGTLTLTGKNDHQYTELLGGTTTIIRDSKSLGRGTTTMAEGSILGFGAADLTPTTRFSLEGHVTMDTWGNDAKIDKQIDGGIGSSLTKAGDGTLTLTVANRFNGLEIDGGRLVAWSQDALGVGAVTNNSELEINFASGVEEFLRRNITSTNGTFIKSGDGRMNVDFTLNTQAFVMNGGTLGVKLGAGLVTATNGFTVASGSTLVGMYESAAGLSRGSENARSFEVLRGANAGNFTQRLFETDLEHVEWSTRTSGNSLYYDLWVRSFVESYEQYLSENATNAAGAADMLPENDPLFVAVNGLRTTDEVVQAFSELHGEIYETAIFAQADMQRQFNDLVLRRRIYCEHAREFKGLRAQSRDKRLGDSLRPNRDVWVQFTGGGTFRSQIGKYSAYDMGRFGVATGLEQQVTRNFFSGLAFGYDQATLKLADMPSKDRLDAFRLSIYGGYHDDNDVSVMGYFGYAKNWHHVERQIAFLHGTALAAFNDDVLTTGIDIAKTFHWNSLRFVPSAGLTLVNVQTPFVEESGVGGAGLLVKGNNYTSLRTPIGVRINSDLNVQRMRFTPEFRMFYISEMGTSRINSQTAFASAPMNAFAVDSGVNGRGGFHIGVGLTAEILPRLSLGIDYDGELWDGYQRHDVGANATIRW